MNELREQLQTALSSITSIGVGVALPDNLVSDGVTYLSYELEENTLQRDFDKRYFMQVIFTGRIVRKDNASENTLQILETALEQVESKLKDLNFEFTVREVSQFTDGFKKFAIDGTARYYDKNKTLI